VAVAAGSTAALRVRVVTRPRLTSQRRVATIPLLRSLRATSNSRHSERTSHRSASLRVASPASWRCCRRAAVAISCARRFHRINHYILQSPPPPRSSLFVVFCPSLYIATPVPTLSASHVNTHHLPRLGHLSSLPSSFAAARLAPSHVRPRSPERVCGYAPVAFGALLRSAVP